MSDKEARAKPCHKQNKYSRPHRAQTRPTGQQPTTKGLQSKNRAYPSPQTKQKQTQTSTHYHQQLRILFSYPTAFVVQVTFHIQLIYPDLWDLRHFRTNLYTGLCKSVQKDINQPKQRSTAQPIRIGSAFKSTAETQKHLCAKSKFHIQSISPTFNHIYVNHENKREPLALNEGLHTQHKLSSS